MDSVEWQSFVSDEEIVVVMRFSFLGKSGWKSHFSRSADDLFEDERLHLRMALFETLPLASLAAQTDQKFHLFILCSKFMPDWAMSQLKRLCRDHLPKRNYTIASRSPGVANVYLRRFLQSRTKGPWCFHLVLDDDDGLAADFIGKLRDAMAELSAPETSQLRFVSFAKGYALDVKDLSQARLRVYSHRYPFINLGLAMISPPDGKNILSISHRKVPRKHEHALITHGKQMFVRCVHSGNDSRVTTQQAWSEIANWRSQPDILRRFTFLAQL